MHSVQIAPPSMCTRDLQSEKSCLGEAAEHILKEPGIVVFLLSGFFIDG